MYGCIRTCERNCESELLAAAVLSMVCGYAWCAGLGCRLAIELGNQVQTGMVNGAQLPCLLARPGLTKPVLQTMDPIAKNASAYEEAFNRHQELGTSLFAS